MLIIFHKKRTAKMMKNLKIATFNIQGCKTDKEKIKSLAIDAESYEIQVIGFTESHIETMSIEEVKGKKKIYNVYHNGIKDKNKHTGVGIIVEKEIPAVMNRITDRICTAEIDLNDTKKLIVIVAYAPTQVVSEDNPSIREKFYNDLSEITRNLNRKRHFVISLGDFNAKTGSGYSQFPSNMGKYGKGQLNTNGINLLEYAKEFDMLLTNTSFPHKLSHRTTWTCPERRSESKHHDGSIRRNPYRNQIDYVLIKNDHRRLIQDSRSYSGTETSSDHKIVITKIKLDWWKIKGTNTMRNKIDIAKFNEVQKITEYKQAICTKIEESEIGNEDQSTDEKWNTIVNICKEVGTTVLGRRKRKNRYDDCEIQNLSKSQKQIKLQIESTQNKEKRRSLKKERNILINKIKRRMKLVEEERYGKELEQIEKSKSNQKSYEAVKLIKKMKPKKKLNVFDENGKFVSAVTKQVDIITKVFKKTFEQPDEEEMKYYPPCENKPPFNEREIYLAAKKLKNGKSPGIDDIPAEMIKNAPMIIHQKIAEILNISVETEDYLKILRVGVLTPLQKPPKKEEERKNNFRPIILLPIIRKILAICVIERTWKKMESRIPPDQAAYQKGRSTTEQVFCLKVLVEKAITSQDYKIIIMMIDMSKAFDTVNRKKLMELMEPLLDENEMRMMYLLIGGVELVVRIDKETGKRISTNIGVAQGDCLSALLFIFYLAHILIPMPQGTIREDHKDICLWSELDWILDKDKINLELDPKYADDVTYIRSHESKINKIKRLLPSMLQEGNLIENSSKREEYNIPSERNEWKLCKCLGSLLDTEADIQRRKGLAISSMRTLYLLFKSRNISQTTKIRIFEAYVSSIFLYNSELWVSTKTIANKIDSFQRRQLRKVLNIKWPKVISNIELYKKTKVIKWSTVIKKRRLSWLGHLLRLKDDTPARKALSEAVSDHKRRVGRSKITWLDTIKKDVMFGGLILNFKSHKTMINDLEGLCKDRDLWKITVKHMMLIDSTYM